MKIKSLKIALLGMALPLMVTCEDSTFMEGNATERISYLYLNYWNTDTLNNESSVYGNCPQIELDEDNTSADVVIDFEKTFTGKLESNKTAKIIMDNVRIFDDFGSYKIKEIKVEELRDGFWIMQSNNENPVTFQDLEQLDVAIVMDNSKYLDHQFDNMKANAISFIKTVNSNIKNAKFSIVSTAGGFDNIKVTNLAEANSAIETINKMEKDDYSFLFSGCKKAMDMLNTGTSSSKVMVYFGAGNYSQTDTISKNDIEDLLKSDKYNKIQSFAIGYSDEGQLTSDTKKFISSFCIRGFALYPTEGDKLKEFFNYFSHSLASAYNIIYTREATKFNQDNKQQIRFRLITEQL
ncbi:MAG: VWA domain-containing protein [Bacteroidales bacterium]|nr:VWA domain-containing protein [Bacteroidales bacterium]